MKGIVFNVLQEVVSREHGEDTWDQLLTAAGLDGVYTSLGSYPDQDLYRLVGAAATTLNRPADDIVRWFGEKAMPLFAEKFPKFFEPHRSTRAFVLTLNDIIHPEVRKLYPGADVPVFGYDTSSPEHLGMTYQSPRKLCALAEGLILGAARAFGEAVTFEHPECMKRGDGRCRWRLTFARLEVTGSARAA